MQPQSAETETDATKIFFILFPIAAVYYATPALLAHCGKPDRSDRVACRKLLRSVVGRFEIVLADAADRAMPVRRQVFERHVVMLGRIVDPAADLAHVFELVHNAPRFPKCARKAQGRNLRLPHGFRSRTRDDDGTGSSSR